MKRLFFLFCIVQLTCASAQLGLKLSHLRPTGKFGATQKPTVGFEAFYKPGGGEDDDRRGLHIRIGISYAKFTARKDTFPTYGVISSQGTTVTPGYTVIHKYSLGALFMGLDYMFELSDAFYLYPGLDIGVQSNSISYDSYTPMISSESYSGGYVFIGLRARLGAEYRINSHFGVIAECMRSMNFSPEVGGLAYNDYGLGVRIHF